HAGTPWGWWEFLPGHGRYGETTGKRVERLVAALGLRFHFGLGLRPGEEHHHENEQHARSQQHPGADGQRPGHHVEVQATEVEHALVDRYDDDPAERDRDEDLPSEVHELVVTEAQERTAQPYEEEHEQPQLEEEP